MKSTRLKQFVASFLVVLSLLVSSVSACTCTHNSPQAETSEHCQPEPPQHSHESNTDSHHSHNESASGHQHDEQAKINFASLSFSETECCCISPAPKVFTKSEKVKTEKQASRLLSKTEIEVRLTPQIVSVKTVEFTRPFYLSDSFHNLTPGRAPPSL
jgi:hypothetical protein